MAHWKDYLREAIRLLGSQPKLADAIRGTGVECSQSKISWLLVHADNISAEDALAVHRVTDGRVPASALRPDLWTSPDHIPACGELSAQAAP